MEKPTCADCKFIDYRNITGPVCVRFPQAVAIDRGYWCGEYVALGDLKLKS